MKKSVKIIIAVVVIIAIIAVVAIFLTKQNSNPNTNSSTNLPEITSQEDLEKLVNQIYENVNQEMYSTITMPIDLSDEASVKSYTGLENGDNLEYAVVSEPMINAQAYSLVLAKVKDGVNANEVAKTMSENINTRKWICVSAEKLYATNSGNVVFLVMTNEEMATAVYNSFKAIAGTVGEEYEKTEQEGELPPDTLEPGAFEVPTNEVEGFEVPVDNNEVEDVDAPSNVDESEDSVVSINE